MGIIGGLIGAGASVFSAERQMAFQKEMAKNRYQYMVGDLEKAGLNRMLAIGGASPPQGAQGASADMASAFAATSKSGREERLVKKEVTKKDEETALLKEQQNQSREAAVLSTASAHAQVSAANKNEIETQLLHTQLSSAKAKEMFDKSKEGQALIRFNRMMEAIGGGMGSIFGLRDGMRKGIRNRKY